MKISKFSQALILVMPIICVIASAGIVAQQSIRRGQLERKVAAFEREYYALDKQHKALQKAAGEPVTADASSAEHHDHHDGDGD